MKTTLPNSMVLFNYATKELTAKIVYYGPGLCGKTTNLEYLHSNVPAHSHGDLVSLATKTDRTLFFDLLPVELGTIRGMRTRLQLYTVPGQVFYNSTRKLVLKGADGIVFVADSQEQLIEANKESFENLKANLKEHEQRLEEMPVVLQFNKRDLPNILPVEVLNDELNECNAPIFEAVAITGIGVQDTLRGITKLVLNRLAKKDRSLDRKVSVAVAKDEDTARTVTASTRKLAPPPVATPPADEEHFDFQEAELDSFLSEELDMGEGGPVGDPTVQITPELMDRLREGEGKSAWDVWDAGGVDGEEAALDAEFGDFDDPFAGVEIGAGGSEDAPEFDPSVSVPEAEEEVVLAPVVEPPAEEKVDFRAMLQEELDKENDPFFSSHLQEDASAEADEQPALDPQPELEPAAPPMQEESPEEESDLSGGMAESADPLTEEDVGEMLADASPAASSEEMGSGDAAAEEALAQPTFSPEAESAFLEEAALSDPFASDAVSVESPPEPLPEAIPELAPEPFPEPAQPAIGVEDAEAEAQPFDETGKVDKSGPIKLIAREEDGPEIELSDVGVEEVEMEVPSAMDRDSGVMVEASLPLGRSVERDVEVPIHLSLPEGARSIVLRLTLRLHLDDAD